MKNRVWPHRISIALLALLLAASATGSLQAEKAPTARWTSAASPNLGPRINEVMPKPETGDFEWVELYNTSSPYYVYLPLVLRNTSASGRSVRLPQVPQPATAGGLVDISGWQVTDEDGNTYSIPAALPVVPPEAYVLIIFDGLGPTADDYDFSDGLAVLHTPAGLVDVFEDAADQVGLYSSSTHNSDTIVDFVAWGEPPGEDAANAVGIWSETWCVSMHTGSGAVLGDEPPGGSLGVRPGRGNDTPSDWAVYLGDDLSPGAGNPLPRA
jgi:hypothetical protein